MKKQALVDMLTTFNPISAFISMEALSKSADSKFYKGFNGSRKQADKRSHKIYPMRVHRANVGHDYFNKNIRAINTAITDYAIDTGLNIQPDETSIYNQLNDQIEQGRYEHIGGIVYKDTRTGNIMIRYFQEKNLKSETIAYYDEDGNMLDYETQVKPYKKEEKTYPTIKTIVVKDIDGNEHTLSVELPFQFRQLSLDGIKKITVNGKTYEIE